MTETVDYEAAIAALKAKRQAYLQSVQAIEIAIAELEALSGSTSTSPDAPENTIPVSPQGSLTTSHNRETTIRSDSFWGMSITEAAKKFLDMVKRPQDTSSIAKALKEGGNLSTSPNFVPIVHRSLTRNKEFQRVKNEWGLAKWYVGRSIPVEVSSKAKRKSKKKKRKVSPKSETNVADQT